MAARIATALCALALAAGLAVELRAHDLLASAAATAKAPHPSTSQVDAALSKLRTVSRLQPGGGALQLAAAIDLRARRFAAAERSATRATGRDPDNFAAWVTLGVVRQAAGDDRGGRSAFARAHTLNPMYSTPR